MASRIRVARSYSDVHTTATKAPRTSARSPMPRMGTSSSKKQRGPYEILVVLGSSSFSEDTESPKPTQYKMRGLSANVGNKYGLESYIAADLVPSLTFIKQLYQHAPSGIVDRKSRGSRFQPSLYRGALSGRYVCRSWRGALRPRYWAPFRSWFRQRSAILAKLVLCAEINQ